MLLLCSKEGISFLTTQGAATWPLSAPRRPQPAIRHGPCEGLNGSRIAAAVHARVENRPGRIFALSDTGELLTLGLQIWPGCKVTCMLHPSQADAAVQPVAVLARLQVAGEIGGCLQVSNVKNAGIRSEISSFALASLPGYVIAATPDWLAVHNVTGAIVRAGPRAVLSGPSSQAALAAGLRVIFLLALFVTADGSFNTHPQLAQILGKRIKLRCLACTGRWG